MEFKNEIARWGMIISLYEFNEEIKPYLRQVDKIYDGDYFIIGYSPFIQQPHGWDKKGTWYILQEGYHLQPDEDTHELVLFYDLDLYKRNMRMSTPCPGCELCQVPISQK